MGAGAPGSGRGIREVSRGSYRGAIGYDGNKNSGVVVHVNASIAMDTALACNVELIYFFQYSRFIKLEWK